uniref:Uncharacterized protein n=1 Tax=Yersinia pseudotuberculosis serotype O:3 (strain YPIII) TaxID=502800 RepID=A0A0H3B0D0_YERPY
MNLGGVQFPHVPLVCDGFCAPPVFQTDCGNQHLVNNLKGDERRSSV